MPVYSEMFKKIYDLSIGNENSVHDIVFAADTGRLILKGEAARSTEIFGVDEARIVRI